MKVSVFFILAQPRYSRFFLDQSRRFLSFDEPLYQCQMLAIERHESHRNTSTSIPLTIQAESAYEDFGSSLTALPSYFTYKRLLCERFEEGQLMTARDPLNSVNLSMEELLLSQMRALMSMGASPDLGVRFLIKGPHYGANQTLTTLKLQE
ncbi:hypothetical protein BDZ97DRAFT_715448 [Flammula alnicola]|nr:hypothetical protein BDZ97DRAFT_715448 [Flammula alnicola]